jgi:tetratricopeptide (TPR) repeat protein
MANDEINSLKQNVGQFVSINSFLSTTAQRETALFFLGDGTPTDDLKRVLFEIDADPRVVTTKPFADISSHSDFPIETEVLFMLGSIFRLNKITLGDNQLWIIEMALCSDDEHDLRQVITHMKNQNSNGETDLRILAKIVRTMGKFDLAEKCYLRLINGIAPNDPSLITLYNDLGEITAQKGEYDVSIEWHNKAIEITSRLENPPINDTNVSVAVSSIGKFIGF